MRILGMMVMMMFFAVGAASAAIVNLTNGNVVQGNIIEQNSKSLQISVDGVTMTYYADEIKDIDGKPLVAAQTEPAAAPAPVVEPEVAPEPEPAPAVEPEVAAKPTPAPAVEPEVAAKPTPAPAVEPEVAAKPTPALAVEPVVAPKPAPAAVASAPVAGTVEQDKKALILKFIDVFGTRQALINNFDLMLKQIEKEKPDEAQKIRERVKVDEIIERLLPIYDRNFTSDDLKAFIVFYGSAQGQKLISTIPELMKESVKESVKYMEEKFPEAKGGQ